MRLASHSHGAFAQSPHDPGHIKGYFPGVRENGGQYTHAAIWTAMAFAQVGEHERAWELYALLNPIHHSATPAALATYKVEPYVVAADVYAAAPHTGRGGWTWYTGAPVGCIACSLKHCWVQTWKALNCA